MDRNTLSSSDRLAYNVQEAADLLGISRPTMTKLINNKEIPSFYVGTRRIIPHAGIMQWFDQQILKEQKKF